jgi:excisionase family DNA binding protein
MAMQDDASHGTDSARLLRLDDVADRLNVSRSMAWKLTAYGHLRTVRIGRAVRVRPADLEAYLARAADDGRADVP